MKAVTYRLRLLEPVLVSQAESGEENSAVGLPFIPGSAIRGALASRFLQTSSSPDPAVDETFRRLFLDGAVCFLNAYPWREGARALPRPLSWMTEKDEADNDTGTTCDWAVDPDQELERPKAVEGEFCVMVEDTAYLASAERQVNVHISLQDANERGRENTVYRYDALAVGEVLAGAVVSEDDHLLDHVLTLLNAGGIALGTAHRAGYGWVEIENVALSQESWNEHLPAAGVNQDEVVVTLLSDAIVRGNNGQVDGDISTALETLLGVAGLKPIRSYCNLRLVGGYNRKWGVPLPQSWAVQAGSTYVYPSSSFDPDQLQRSTQLGIGERRAEGFGRLAVNWQTHAELRREKASLPGTAKAELTEESRAIAMSMATRSLKLLLDRQLAAAVNGAALGAQRPQNSQLARVRNAAQQAIVSSSFDALLHHLANLKGAREQFEKARIGNTALDRWIEERARTLDIEIQMRLGNVPLPEVAGQRAELSQELKIEYTARLIDGVMKKAAKLNQKKEEGS